MSIAHSVRGRHNPTQSQTVERKLRMAQGLFQMAFRVKSHQLRKKNPQLSEREIGHRAYALIEKGCK